PELPTRDQSSSLVLEAREDVRRILEGGGSLSRIESSPMEKRQSRQPGAVVRSRQQGHEREQQ
ncbi:unnamed protein product, partial [Amoebophrya sp. A25]